MDKLSKDRLQKLAGLITESSYHFAQHDHLLKVIEKHVIGLLRDLDINPEDQPIVFDDLFHHIKRYLSKIVSEQTSPEAAQDLQAYFGKPKKKKLEEQAEEELGFDLEKRMEEPDVPMEIVDGIMVVNWGDVLDVVMPNYWDDFQKHLDSKGKHGYPSYNETTEAVGKWADEHNGLVWSWGGDRWMSRAETQQAVRKAKEAGKTLVVMEYLS